MLPPLHAHVYDRTPFVENKTCIASLFQYDAFGDRLIFCEFWFIYRWMNKNIFKVCSLLDLCLYGSWINANKPNLIQNVCFHGHTYELYPYQPFVSVKAEYNKCIVGSYHLLDIFQELYSYCSRASYFFPFNLKISMIKINNVLRFGSIWYKLSIDLTDILNKIQLFLSCMYLAFSSNGNTY